jgi:hypothetical protein
MFRGHQTGLPWRKLGVFLTDLITKKVNVKIKPIKCWPEQTACDEKEIMIGFTLSSKIHNFLDK